MSRRAALVPVSDRTTRLRARRINVDVGSLGSVHATMSHAELGRLEGEVRDLSLHGLGIELSAGADAILFAGDRLEALQVRSGDHLLFEGAGLVRRIGEDADKLVVGVELEGGGLDLAELYRQEARHGFTLRLQAFENARARNLEISQRFKAWVADLRSGLESLRTFLAAEERSLAAEDQATRLEAERQILEAIQPWLVREMAGARAELSELVQGFSDEEHQLHRAYLKPHVAHLFAESPFMRRASEKPLGYAGDYEMMNMLYREHREGSSLFGKALNLYATNEEAAIANINRIEYLSGIIQERVASYPSGRVRLASIGCGPAREIAAFLTDKPELGGRLDVALLDQEDRSISYCERTLAPLAKATGARIQVIRESVRRLLGTSELGEALGERELIYSAGLFDYLAERTFRALLSVLYGALAPNGMLVIGNVAGHNPSRWTMEYFSEWFLIHRSPEDLVRLGDGLQPSPANLEVKSEPSGVNLFLTIHR